jgi:hypothetical protein
MIKKILIYYELIDYLYRLGTFMKGVFFLKTSEVRCKTDPARRDLKQIKIEACPLRF